MANTLAELAVGSDDIAVIAQAVVALQNASSAEPIVGPAGPQGIPGPIGPQGPVGPQGVAGPTGAGSTGSGTLTFAEVIAALQQGPNGTGTVTTGGGTVTTTTPSLTGETVNTSADPNFGLYPFAMPPNVPPGGPINLGTGPNSAQFILSGDPGGGECVVDLILEKPDGTSVGIAGPLTITSNVGQTTAGAQVITIKLPCGDIPRFQIAPGAGGVGTNGLFMMGASIDLVPMVCWGQDDSRGGDADGGTWTFISNDSAIYVQPASAPLPPGETASAPTGVTATGATSYTAVPTQISDQTLSQILATGGNITLPAQEIVGTGNLPGNATVTGAGMGKTIIDGTTLEPTLDKALIVLDGPGVTLSGLTIQNAYIPAALGLNAAGVRNADPSEGFTLNGVELTLNQNGVLTDESSVGPFLVENCNAHHNGEITMPGDTHNFYFGGLPSAVLTLNNNISTLCRDVHAFKSRCGTTIATGNTVGTGGYGSCYDIPNGGLFSASNETWTLNIAPIAANQDDNFLTYGTENANNAAIGQTVTLTNIVFNDLTGSGGILQCGALFPNSILNLVGCTYKGNIAPTVAGRGWGTINGTITKAA